MHGMLPNGPWMSIRKNALPLPNQKNPWVKPTVIHPRVIKGGSWTMMQRTLRSSARVASSFKIAKKDDRRYQKVFLVEYRFNFIDLEW